MITTEEKNMITKELESIGEINLITFYDRNNGFRIQSMSHTPENRNEIEIECEKEEGGTIYLEFSQQPDYGDDDYGYEDKDDNDDGFKIFPKNILSLEDAVEKIKDLLKGLYGNTKTKG
jgi:hypothetical protein